MYSLLIFDLSIDDKKNKIIESEELTIFSPFKTNPQNSFRDDVKNEIIL